MEDVLELERKEERKNRTQDSVKSIPKEIAYFAKLSIKSSTRGLYERGLNLRERYRSSQACSRSISGLIRTPTPC